MEASALANLGACEAIMRSSSLDCAVDWADDGLKIGFRLREPPPLTKWQRHRESVRIKNERRRERIREIRAKNAEILRKACE